MSVDFKPHFLINRIDGTLDSENLRSYSNNNQLPSCELNDTNKLYNYAYIYIYI